MRIELSDIIPMILMFVCSLSIIRLTLYKLNWANRNLLFRSSLFLWFNWAVSGILSIIFFRFLSPSDSIYYFLFFVYLLNIFSNFYVLLHLQKDNFQESFLTEKAKQKIPEKFIWKTAIILSVVTNSIVVLVAYTAVEIVIFIQKTFPKTPTNGIDFTVYG